MNKDFFEALEALEKEKGISADYMMERVETALVSAFKRDNGGLGNVRVKLDPVKKEVRMYQQLEVVEEVEDSKTQISVEAAHEKSKKYNVGDIFEKEIKPKNFGRISAQAAKQVIIQGIREAERGMMIKEYAERKEEIVSAVVVRVDPNTDNVVLEVGKNEMMLYKHEQIAGESFNVGDRTKVFITEIKKEMRGPTIVLSRTHPGLVARLFELEVPEIKDGTVTINAVAREAGSRTKIAVSSADPDVDPIGSCIGPKGMRKNSVSAELCDEKIDIIKYSENCEEFISAALAPANVISVTKLPDGERSYRVIVNDDQLSLAIGRKGQNARLAAKLTGCKIDIKSVKSLEELEVLAEDDSEE